MKSLIKMIDDKMIDEIAKHISKQKYIFIGEIHGVREINDRIFEILNVLGKEKIVLCIEMPRQAEDILIRFLQGKISKNELLKSKHLADMLQDKRLHDGALSLYKKLYDKGADIIGLEDYDGEPSERDKNMAERFMEIIKERKADRYIVYAGNFHVIEKAVKIAGFEVTPIKTYLPDELLSKILTIQFVPGEKEEILFDEKTKTIEYRLSIRRRG